MKLSPAAAYLLDTLNDSGYKSWLVGGCVRDSLRGIMPHDFDIATVALPQQVMSCFPEFNVLPTGIRHGTVTVVADGNLLEITTLRADGTYSDGRHPDGVTFVTDIYADLARRDFTINAMAWSSTDGLLDPFGGERDLAVGLLRCVGDPVARLRQDSLRIMRCLRFASCLGFDIEPDTAAALYSECEELRQVAVERLNHELSMLICGENAGATLHTHRDILAVIIPEIIPNIDQNLLNLAENDCAVRLALLFGEGQSPKLPLKRLRADSNTVRRATVLWELLHRPLPCSRADAVELTLSAGRSGMEELLQLWQAQSTLAEQPVERLTTAIGYATQVLDCGCCTTADLSIDGDTLIDLGIPPSKELGRLMQELTRCVMLGSCPNEVRRLTELARRLYHEGKM